MSNEQSKADIAQDVRNLQSRLNEVRLEVKEDLAAERRSRKEEMQRVSEDLEEIRMGLEYKRGASTAVNKLIRVGWTLFVGLLSYFLGTGSLPTVF